jgi:hypothetical protein
VDFDASDVASNYRVNCGTRNAAAIICVIEKLGYVCIVLLEHETWQQNCIDTGIVRHCLLLLAMRLPANTARTRRVATIGITCIDNVQYNKKYEHGDYSSLITNIGNGRYTRITFFADGGFKGKRTSLRTKFLLYLN